MKILRFIFIFLISLPGVSGQQSSFLDQIRQDSAIDFYLRLDWKTLERKKMDKAFQPASSSVITPDHDTLQLNVRVKTRGHMRLEICSSPPLKLKFDKEDLSDNGFSSFNEMDIVNHCMDGELYDQYLLREYLAYKLWELVSPFGFHTQLIKLHYLNADGTVAHKPAEAFLVENPEELVARYGGREYKNSKVSNNALEKDAFLTLSLFQFMIGNTDWYIPSRHNLEFIAIPGHQLLVTIPYDFDYSGLVDAPYAAHHASINLSSVTMRYYQGWCQTEEEFNMALQVFRDKKQAILSMPHQIQGLDERSVKYTTQYLEEFFTIIENPQKLKNQILKHCDMWPVKN